MAVEFSFTLHQRTYVAVVMMGEVGFIMLLCVF